MVCPDCGNAEFSAQHPATVLRTYRVDDGNYPYEVSEEIVDVDRDFDSLTCTDCGAVYEIDDLVYPDLTSP